MAHILIYENILLFCNTVFELKYIFLKYPENTLQNESGHFTFISPRTPYKY